MGKTYDPRLEVTSDGMTYATSLIKIGSGIQAILSVYLSNLRGSNSGITDGRNL
jgi:hypothetical protein